MDGSWKRAVQVRDPSLGPAAWEWRVRQYAALAEEIAAQPQQADVGCVRVNAEGCCGVCFPARSGVGQAAAGSCPLPGACTCTGQLPNPDHSDPQRQACAKRVAAQAQDSVISRSKLTVLA